MLPFAIKIRAYRVKQAVLKWYIKTFPFPVPVLFSGPGSARDLCSAVAQMGTRKLLIVTDRVLIELGLLDDIRNTLESLGVACFLYDGVKPDPDYRQVEAALALLRKEDCEAVLAVGGGSPLDAAKLVSARATNDKPIDRLIGMFRIRRACLPLYVVPTTAGSGSEVTVAAIITDDATHQKKAVIDPKLVPLMAALDGTLMTGIPAEVTAITGMDALTHAVEAYLSANAQPASDRFALAATRLIAEHLPRAVRDGWDLEARQGMALASFYAGLAFTKAGVGYVHAISHALGGRYGITHGLANSVILPHILDHAREAVGNRLSRLAEVSCLTDGLNSGEIPAQAFIDFVRSLQKQFELPVHLEELREEDVPDIARAALKEAHASYAVPRYMNQSDCEKLIMLMAS